ncbi:hypothetical protein CCP3SC15_1820003 [Gammaproteobacteria bacterium]
MGLRGIVRPLGLLPNRHGAAKVPGNLKPHLRMNMLKKMAASCGLVAITVSQALAVGVADTEVASGLDNTSATWALIKPVSIGIVVFLIVRRLLRKV